LAAGVDPFFERKVDDLGGVEPDVNPSGSRCVRTTNSFPPACTAAEFFYVEISNSRLGMIQTIYKHIEVLLSNANDLGWTDGGK
jgi:hypothetical protein